MRWCLAAIPALLLNAQEPAPGIATLSKIKTNVEANLRHLPDYTCAQTTERSTRLASSQQFERLDRIRLEVAYVGGKELFGWPGDTKIDQPDITKLVAGTVGTGQFGSFTSAIFRGGSAQFVFAGETKLNGAFALQYNYRIPKSSSSYVIRTQAGEANVGYHGSIWANAGSLDLLRIEVAADDIPSPLGLKATRAAMDYARVPIGNSTFLLPQSSELVMTEANGDESRNLNLLQSCRQFVGESVLTFGDGTSPAAPAPVASAAQHLELPEQFLVQISLTAPIDFENSAVGDTVHAVLREPIRRNGTVAVPKGAELLGRIRVLQKKSKAYVFDLSFVSIQSGSAAATLANRENSLGVDAHNRKVQNTEEGPLQFRVGRFKLERGATLILQSRRLR